MYLLSWDKLARMMLADRSWGLGHLLMDGVPAPFPQISDTWPVGPMGLWVLDNLRSVIPATERLKRLRVFMRAYAEE